MNNFVTPPLVSVIIPVYNGEKYLQACLDSVSSQTYKTLETLIVDDGSTDRSMEIAENWPGPKTLIRQKNGDVSSARNAGAEAARGEFLAFLDQDDLWEPEKVRKQIALFSADPSLDLVFTDLIKFFPGGKRHHASDKHTLALSLTRENLFKKLAVKNVLMPSAVMVKKSSFMHAGRFDPSFKTCGDYELWLRMAAMDMNFRYLPEPLTLYRYHGENTSRKTEVMHLDRVKVMDKIFSLSFLPGRYRALENRAKAEVFMIGAHTFFSSRNYEKFLENFYIAARLSKASVSPRSLRRWVKSWIRLKTKGIS